MNNEEKKRFIIEVHRMFMNYRPYDRCLSLDEMKFREDAFWNNYHHSFYSLLPESLFKYRKPTEDAIKNFEDDNAWFSHPADFDDTVDSVIFNDLESELEEFEKSPKRIIEKLSKSFVHAFASAQGIDIDEKQIEEALPLFNLDGSINEPATRNYLADKMPEDKIDECVERLKINTSQENNNVILKSAKGFMMNFIDINKKIRSETFVFSMAEDCDSQAMWGLYADESKGFCIEYQFPKDTFLGQRMILNLFPIYYGEKPLVSFFDVLVKGIYAKQKVNGISFEDYKDFFVSAYTKDKSYEFQNEWRITFDKNMGGHLQKFPFVKSIILGERMTEENKNRLIEIARKKNIKIYQRQLNATGSKVIKVEF